MFRAVITVNDLYLLVNEAGKAIIYQPDYDPVLKRRRFDRLSIRDLQALYLPGPASDWWSKGSRRR